MILTILKKMAWFVVLVLVQVLVLNRIHILGYATPFLYIYLIVKMEYRIPRSVILLIGFLLGLTMDMFTNTLGVNASATVLLAFMQPFFLKMFAPRDVEDDLVPERRQIGAWSFCKYVVLCVCLHHTVLLMLEYFTFVGILQTLLRIVVCSLFTIIMILAVDKAIN